MEVNGQLHEPFTLYPGKEPGNGTLREPQSRSGRFAEGQDLFPLTGIET
jgi:hypothetical protein